jgi:UDP-glucose 4-epimerase
MKVLVTGGAGYIGSHICKALRDAGFSPVTLDNFSTGNRWAVRFGPLEYGDLLDPLRLQEVFAAHRPRAVIHCGGASLVG